MKAKVGDRGQRYEIRCDEDEGGPEMVIGWSNDPRAFAETVRLHPCWRNHRAVDRLDPAKAKPGTQICPYCMEHVPLGTDHRCHD